MGWVSRLPPHSLDRSLQMRQAAMEEVTAAGKYDDPQVLRTSPRQHVGEGNDVVLLAVNDDRIGTHGVDGKAIHRRPDQDQPFVLHRLRNARLDERAERKS